MPERRGLGDPPLTLDLLLSQDEVTKRLTADFRGAVRGACRRLTEEHEASQLVETPAHGWLALVSIGRIAAVMAWAGKPQIPLAPTADRLETSTCVGDVNRLDLHAPGTMGHIRLSQLLRTAIHTTLRRFGVDMHRIQSDRWLRQMPVQTVLDVGANVGQFAHAARQLFPAAQIYSFEPLVDCFQDLRQAFRNDPLWRGYQCALGSKEDVGFFHRSANPQSSSLLAMADLHKEAFPGTGASQTETVRIHRLDDVLVGVELTADVLLKLDVQGFEDRVLDGATRVLAQSRMVLTEVSFYRLYNDQATFEEIHARLHEAGFAFHGIWGQLCHPTDGRILQADAIFLRNDQ